MENLITLEEVKEDFSNIQISNYKSFTIKKTIISTILEATTKEYNSLKKIDYCTLEMVKCYAIVNYYTNLDLTSLDVIDAYDQLQEKGIATYVLKCVPHSELAFFDTVIHAEIEQLQRVENSMEMVVANALTHLINKLPDDKALAKLVKSLPKEVNKINPEKLSFISKAINWNNGVENANI